MTDAEKDAEIGRIARDYNENERQLACLRSRLTRHARSLRELADRVINHLNGSALSDAEGFAGSDTIKADLAAFTTARDERERLVALLEQVGLTHLHDRRDPVAY